MTEKMIHDMIENNILHLRPCKNWSFDMTNPPREAVLTAEYPLSLVAMKHILETN